MYLKSSTLAAAMSVAALSAHSATLSFDQPDLVTGVEDGTFASVTHTKSGVTMTTTANTGGAVHIYNSGSGEEVLSAFATNHGPVSLTAANFTSLGGTSLDANAQTINTSTGRGKGSVTYSGADFTGLFFDHSQAPRNIGFTVTNVSVELAPVPLPAALPLLVGAMGGLGFICGKRRTRT